jgi:hypothetical protein
VRAVGEGDRQRDRVVIRGDLADQHGSALLT